MFRSLLFLCVPLSLLTRSATAAAITYDVSVNTSSIAGTPGSVDFQFNPGPLITQTASLQIRSFSGNGTLAGSPTVSGDVGGMLPATLSFDNNAPFNDYFESFTFGTNLTFEVSLSGPALSTPDGMSTSGSTFAFSMFSDPIGTMPALTSDLINGFAFLVDVTLDGTTMVTNSSSETTVVPEGSVAVPEPSSLGWVGVTGVLLMCFPRQRQYRERQNRLA